jgi:hypothetical protein
MIRWYSTSTLDRHTCGSKIHHTSQQRWKLLLWSADSPFFLSKYFFKKMCQTWSKQLENEEVRPLYWSFHLFSCQLVYNIHIRQEYMWKQKFIMHQNLYLASTLDRYPCESKIYHASLLVFSIHIRQVHLWKQNASYFTNCTGIVLSTLDRYTCGSKINHTSTIDRCTMVYG